MLLSNPYTWPYYELVGSHEMLQEQSDSVALHPLL